MNLYRSKGRIWTGTQADARAANDGSKDFEHIDVPTDKAGLIGFLNEMEQRLAGGAPPAPVERDDDQADPEAPVISVRHSGSPPPIPVSACVACQRDARAAKMVTGAMSSICAQADIEDMDVKSLDKLIKAAQARRKLLSGDC